MLTQRYQVAPASMELGKTRNGPLSAAVKRSVQTYIREMGEEPLADLYELVLSEIEAPLLECVLAHTDNNQSQSAEILGLNRGTLRKKLKKYGML